LDNESESIVQAALDKLMASNDRTIVVIAHRVCSSAFAFFLFLFIFLTSYLVSFSFFKLSTIRNANRIAFVSDGKVKEIGCVVTRE
jgi:ABC-type multidrug transport system fused ATPase/permease subunit